VYTYSFFIAVSFAINFLQIDFEAKTRVYWWFSQNQHVVVSFHLHEWGISKWPRILVYMSLSSFISLGISVISFGNRVWVLCGIWSYSFLSTSSVSRILSSLFESFESGESMFWSRPLILRLGLRIRLISCLVFGSSITLPLRCIETRVLLLLTAWMILRIFDALKFM